MIEDCTHMVENMHRQLLKLNSCWNYAELMLGNVLSALRKARARYQLLETSADDLLLSAV